MEEKERMEEGARERERERERKCVCVCVGPGSMISNGRADGDQRRIDGWRQISRNGTNATDGPADSIPPPWLSIGIAPALFSTNLY